MASSSGETIDLGDLKLLPAWVKESSEEKSYAHYEGDEGERRSEQRDGRPRDRRERSVRPRTSSGPDRDYRRGGRAQRDNRERRPSRDKRQLSPDRAPVRRPLEFTARFVPHPPAFESVAAQIRSGSVAYSLFSIARLFLEKPERYDVRLTGKPESPLYQIGEKGAIAADRQFLEASSFRFAREDFYKIEVTQSEPIKGNFSSVARCGLSGILLGPTNHHNYQPRLRTLYEQRFSRRMSFPDYQRNIAMISDPAEVEKWKEEARNVTTFSTLREEPPSTFSNEADAERHFRQNYLPGLVRAIEEVTIDGVTSRRMPDQALRRFIEEAWSAESRSPSIMMQELAKQFRDAGLQVFRHRRGMLFVSPIRVRAFAHEQTSVSAPIKGILEALTAHAGINRKDLAEKLIGSPAPGEGVGEDGESRKLALASDLHWLISEGYVIEFNDGSLDLPRAKTKPQETAEQKASETQMEGGASVTPEVTAAQELAPPARKSVGGFVGSTESRPTDVSANMEVGVPTTPDVAGSPELTPPADHDEQLESIKQATASTTASSEAEIGGA